MLGKQVFHDRLKKALSSRSKVGVDRLLDHVNLLSSRGNSISASSLIVLLKACASRWWKFGLFFSCENRRRLKSPTISQGVLSSSLIDFSSSRKACLRLWHAGAYMLVRMKGCGWARDVSLIEVAKL